MSASGSVWSKTDIRNSWKHCASMIMDGNFSAQHRQMKNPHDDVRLADGHGFMVEDAPYKEHLRTAFHRKEVRPCPDQGKHHTNTQTLPDIDMP